MSNLAPSDLSVMIGIPVYKDLPWQVTKSLMSTQLELRELGVRFAVTFLSGSAVITKARSDIVHAFLNSTCNRLFWVDSDIEWSAKDFVNLLALSAHPGMDIVATGYPVKQDDPTYLIKISPEHVLPDGRKYVPHNSWGCLDVAGLGLGFCVMSRDVVETVASTKPWILDEVEGRYIRDVFRIGSIPLGYDGIEGQCPPEQVGKPVYGFMGEDIAFFHDCKEAGYTVWLYPFTDLGHIGTKTYRGLLAQTMGMKVVKDHPQAA